MEKFHLTDPEPLESFELDHYQSFENSEYADQEEISSALQGDARPRALLATDTCRGFDLEAPAYFWHTERRILNSRKEIDD